MTYTTDDLRHALREAAEQPAGEASGSRVERVHAAVRRSRRRRGGAAAAVTVAVVAGVLAVAVGGGPRTSHRQTPPPATSTWSPVTGGVPALWGVRDVAAKVDGRGAEEPTTELTWPKGASGLVVHCTAVDHTIDVTLLPQDRPGTTMAFSCGSGDEWAVEDLSRAASALKPGERVQLTARLEGSDPTATFGVGLLTGRDLIDGSTMRPPHGFDRVASFALSHGFYYTWTGGGIDGTTASKGSSVDSVQLVTESERELRLAARCSGRSTVQVTGEGDRALGTLDCPAGQRVTRELTLKVKPSSDQRFQVQLTDADPGALVQVGVYGR
jgi:hypothetical protein